MKTHHKRHLILFSFLLACALPAIAQEIVVKPERDSGIYAPGEPARWLLEIKGDPTSVSNARYQVKINGERTSREGSLVFLDGKAFISDRLDQPGWLLLEVQATGTAGKTINSLGGVIVAPEQIQRAFPAPEDFDAFWSDKLKELAKVPVDPQLSPIESGRPEVICNKIRMSNFRGTHIYGFLAKPAREGRFPAMLLLQAAGFTRLDHSAAVEMAGRGWLVLNIAPHDVPLDESEEYYNYLGQTTHKNYWNIGSEDRETCYFLRMYLACYRAAEYLSNREDWDGRVLIANGPSQGGLQALITASLHPKITCALADVPAGCDNNAAEVGRRPGWPGWPMQTEGKNIAKVKQTGRYFDLVNFTSRIKCPILVGIGGIDTVCPPTSIYAAVNQVTASKEVIFEPTASHGAGHGRYWTRIGQWIEAKDMPPQTAAAK